MNSRQKALNALSSQLILQKKSERMTGLLPDPPPGWNPWEELANAVIRQAAEDWREAVRTLLHPPGRPGAVQNKHIREAACMLEDCESFFRSRWIRIMTGKDGTEILEQLRRER